MEYWPRAGRDYDYELKFLRLYWAPPQKFPMEIQRSRPRVRIAEGDPGRTDHGTGGTRRDRLLVRYGLGDRSLERADRPWTAREISCDSTPLHFAL